MTDPTTNAITLDSPDVRRLISIAARWELLARLATEVSAMADGKWEPLLLRTREDTYRAVMQLVTLVHVAAPDVRSMDFEQADGMSVSPLVLGPPEVDVIGELVRRALLAEQRLCGHSSPSCRRIHGHGGTRARLWIDSTLTGASCSGTSG
jgi:hypothetical protein